MSTMADQRVNQGQPPSPSVPLSEGEERPPSPSVPLPEGEGSSPSSSAPLPQVEGRPLPPLAHLPEEGGSLLENRRTALVLLALVIAGGLLLRTYGLYGRSMWFDELMSWRTICFSFAEMIESTARNCHAPLFFVLLQAWMALFGESLVALRSFSLAFSAPAMLGVYLFTVEAMTAAAHGQPPHPHPLALSRRERENGHAGAVDWLVGDRAVCR